MVEMKEEFFDWLNDCPVQWQLLAEDNNGSRDYAFIIEENECECEECELGYPEKCMRK